MSAQSQNIPYLMSHDEVARDEEEVDLDVDNDPGNEDPGSQFDRDATVPLIDPDA